MSEGVEVEDAENGDEGVGSGSPFAVPLKSVTRVFVLEFMIHVAYSWGEKLREMEADVESQQTQGYGEGYSGIGRHFGKKRL